MAFVDLEKAFDRVPREVVWWALTNCGGHMYFTRLLLFINDCDSSSCITNLRPTYSTIPIHLKMNTFCFKKIDGLPAKFLGHQVSIKVLDKL